LLDGEKKILNKKNIKEKEHKQKKRKAQYFTNNQNLKKKINIRNNSWNRFNNEAKCTIDF